MLSIRAVKRWTSLSVNGLAFERRDEHSGTGWLTLCYGHAAVWWPTTRIGECTVGWHPVFEFIGHHTSYLVRCSHLHLAGAIRLPERFQRITMRKFRNFLW